MKRWFRWDKRYLYWGLTAFCVIAAAILFYQALNLIPTLGKGIGGLFKILSPFVWGLAITYLLSPIMRWFENTLLLPLGKKLTAKSKKGKTGAKFARFMAVLLAELFLLLVIIALVYMIIPQVYISLEQIVRQSPVYVEKASDYVGRLLSAHPEIEAYISDALGNFNNSIFDLLKTKVLPSLGNVVTNVKDGVVVVMKGLYNLIIGIVVSIYLLGNVEGFIAGSRRVLYSIFSIDAAQWIRTKLIFIDKTFMGFINGSLLDSLIIGLMCYIFCALVNMPYALLVSVIVGVTNVIPFFGPFIGAIPSALIILLENPVKCLVFVIFIIILQQADGNIIKPKILGSSIGINGFWVMFSIILGGGLCGFWGMLLGVPVFVVIHTGITRLIERKLKRSDLPQEASSYRDLDYIDPATREVNYKK